MAIAQRVFYDPCMQVRGRVRRAGRRRLQFGVGFLDAEAGSSLIEAPWREQGRRPVDDGLPPSWWRCRGEPGP